MNIINVIEQEQLRADIPAFRAGDTVRVHVKVVEGTRERIQVFEGLVINRQGGSVRETFTVRRIASGVGVERTFPLHSPRLAKSKLCVVVWFVVLSCITYVISLVKLRVFAKNANFTNKGLPLAALYFLHVII